MRQNRSNQDMSELLLRDLGSMVYDGPEGSIVREHEEGTVITDIEDGAALVQVLEALSLPKLDHLVVKTQAAFDALKAHYGFQGSCPCSQWVYDKKEAPTAEPCDIRLLTGEYARQAAEHYHLVEHSLPYISALIEKQRMWGLFEGDRLAGFIGIHSEGAIGLLEILPEFRRKGYGFALEAHVIRWHLQQGWTPYCHVVDGNFASIHLQEKLGMVQAEQPALWIY